MQDGVAKGWGPYFRNDMLTSMHLPDKFALSPTLFQISTMERPGGMKLNESFYGAIPRCPCYAGGPKPNVTGPGTWSAGAGSDSVACDSATAVCEPPPRPPSGIPSRHV